MNDSIGCKGWEQCAKIEIYSNNGIEVISLKKWCWQCDNIIVLIQFGCLSSGTRAEALHERLI